jgi:hypothetical protein
MRSLRMVIAVLLGTVVVGAFGAGTAPGTTARPRAAKAKHACGLLTTGEITASFTRAPLDPGPTKMAPGVQANFTGCEWNDEQAVGTVPQLIARVFLARSVTKQEATRLTTLEPDSNARPLAGRELEGIGSKGAIEIWPDGSYATVSGLKGKDYYIVSVGYVGAPPVAPITNAEILTLARTAAKRV